MLKELDDYDWRQAFGYAGEEDTYVLAQGFKIESALPAMQISLAPIRREDVAEILALREGERDMRPWYIVGRAKDGRWFALEAGCDYTGWD